MGMFGELAKTIDEMFYLDGYVIEYKTPSGKGLKYIGTYKTYEDAKKLINQIHENKNKIFKRYKGKFSLLKVKYHRLFPDNYFLDKVLEEIQ
jgi:hypothetical protein